MNKKYHTKQTSNTRVIAFTYDFWRFIHWTGNNDNTVQMWSNAGRSLGRHCNAPEPGNRAQKCIAHLVPLPPVPGKTYIAGPRAIDRGLKEKGIQFCLHHRTATNTLTFFFLPVICGSFHRKNVLDRKKENQSLWISICTQIAQDFIMTLFLFTGHNQRRKFYLKQVEII